jgi:two-component sensor histidine kinase
VRLTDLSIHRRAEQFAAAERFARSILEQATEAIVVLAQDGRITRASGKAEQLAGRSPIGLTFSEAFPLETQGEAQPGRLGRFSAEALDTLLASKPFHGVEVGLRGEELANRVFLLSAGPLLDERRAPVGSIVTLTEITERKRAEERQAMLVAELNHRVKNILAVVQAMAFKTIRSSDSLAGFNDAFLGRLRALALAHDLLTQTHWAGTNLDDLIAAILKPHRPLDDDRLAIDGPAVRLPARATVPLSMMLHELTTNAIKYGALSTPTGRIDITWKLADRDDQSVEFIWKERGGPKVERRAVSGFGTALIDRVVSADLGGSSHIDFDPAGICCTVRFHLPRGPQIDTLNLGID